MLLAVKKGSLRSPVITIVLDLRTLGIVVIASLSSQRTETDKALFINLIRHHPSFKLSSSTFVFDQVFNKVVVPNKMVHHSSSVVLYCFKCLLTFTLLNTRNWLLSVSSIFFSAPPGTYLKTSKYSMSFCIILRVFVKIK